MKRKQQDVQIGEDTYTVHEMSVGVMMPLLPKMNGEHAQEGQLELMKQCVFQNGLPLGDEVEELGISTYLILIEEVIKVNGLDKGNAV